MSSSHKKDKRRNFFDIHAVQKHEAKRYTRIKDLIYGRNVLNLKPKFRVRHPWVWGIVVVASAGLMLIGVQQIFTKADVQDFYPATCLGNWQNSANAENDPETLASPDTPFTAANSAVYTSGSQIFCGGFLPSDVATSGQITNVGLTLVWQIGDPSSPAEDPSVITTDTATSTEETSTAASGDPDTADTSTDPSSDTTTTATAAPVTPAPDPTQTAATSSGTSFIQELIPFALAQEVSSATLPVTTSSDATSTIILGPPLTAVLNSTSSDATGASSSASSSAEPIAPPPPVPDNNFLDVSYSTDGQTWVSIGQVNMDNWEQFTVTLPISDWNDLQNLQIRVEGIPTTQDPIPPIYLDGMLLEVHYDVTSLIGSPTATSTDETTSSLSGTPDSGSRMTLVNPGAEQSCDVQPFSQELPLGGTAAFTVNLHPSINGVSYNLLLGDLPAGISAGFGAPSGPIAATSSLTFQAETSTVPGSLNIPVIYQENESNGEVLSNFCQLNVDVE